MDTADGVIHAVVCQHIRTARRTRIEGRWFADCTGDASVGFLAGADLEVTKEGHMGQSNLFNFTEGTSAEPFPKCLCKDTDPIDNAVGATNKPVAFPRCPWALDLRDPLWVEAHPGSQMDAEIAPHSELVYWQFGPSGDKPPVRPKSAMRFSCTPGPMQSPPVSCRPRPSRD